MPELRRESRLQLKFSNGSGGGSAGFQKEPALFISGKPQIPVAVEVTRLRLNILKLESSHVVFAKNTGADIGCFLHRLPFTSGSEAPQPAEWPLTGRFWALTGPPLATLSDSEERVR